MIAVSLHTANWWINFIVSVGFLIGIVWGGLKAINQAREFIHHKVAAKASTLAAAKLEEQIEEIKKQYKPNGGSTMRDAINRIEATLNRLDTKLDLVQSELDKHLGAHEGL
jgi:hypothetical protein